MSPFLSEKYILQIMPDIPFLPDISILNDFIYNPLTQKMDQLKEKGYHSKEWKCNELGTINNIRFPELESQHLNSDICNQIDHSFEGCFLILYNPEMASQSYIAFLFHHSSILLGKSGGKGEMKVLGWLCGKIKSRNRLTD